MNTEHPNRFMSIPPVRPVSIAVGEYEPCFEIGSGGMASVFIARSDTASGRPRVVALKVMHEHLARQTQFRSRFLDEAHVNALIDHPAICRVFEHGDLDSRPYLAMEYLVGEPLSRVWQAMRHRSDAVTLERRTRILARIIADVADGLHAAHETRDESGLPLGIVHRDVTPQNLFVLYDASVRVLDFGIAKHRDREFDTQTTGRLLGKLPYMAPEQIHDEHYDRRVDVWALATVFWELLALHRLFKRDTEVLTVRAVCADPIPNILGVVPSLPTELATILDKALKRDPAARYQTAAEFRDAITGWLERSGGRVEDSEVVAFVNRLFPGSYQERQAWAVAALRRSTIPIEPSITLNSSDALGVVRSAPPEKRSSGLFWPSAVRSQKATSERRRFGWFRGFDVAIALLFLFAAIILIPGPSKQLVSMSTRIQGAAVSAMTPTEPAESKPPAADPDDDFVLDLDDLPALEGAAASFAVNPPPAQKRQKTSREVSVASASQDDREPSTSEDDENAPSTTESESETTGDILIDSPEMPLNVYFEGRLLGTTPVRARLPAGVQQLAVQRGDGPQRLSVSTVVQAGRLRLVTVDVDE